MGSRADEVISLKLIKMFANDMLHAFTMHLCILGRRAMYVGVKTLATCDKASACRQQNPVLHTWLLNNMRNQMDGACFSVPEFQLISSGTRLGLPCARV